MTAIRAVYPDENVMVVEAGVILADVQKAAEEGGPPLLPLVRWRARLCRIGGNLWAPTRVVRGCCDNGNARDLCLGLRRFLPEWADLARAYRLRKNNTGYDLRHLLDRGGRHAGGDSQRGA